MKLIKVLALTGLAAALVGCGGGMSTSTNHPFVKGRFVNKVVECDGLVTDFTLDEGTRLTDRQATKLCSCVNDRYAVRGWEPETLRELQSGQRSANSWKAKALIGRIGQAIQSCEAQLGQ